MAKNHLHKVTESLGHDDHGGGDETQRLQRCLVVLRREGRSVTNTEITIARF